MKRTFLFFVVFLAIAGMASAQSSRQGGGLSSKAIMALENCFDAYDNFVCGGGGGPIPADNVTGTGVSPYLVRWSGAHTQDSSALQDTLTNLIIPYDYQVDFGTGANITTLIHRTFGGAADRFEIDAQNNNAGIAMFVGGPWSVIYDYGGANKPYINMNALVLAGTSGPQFNIIGQGTESAMDSADDRRYHLNIEPASGAHTAGIKYGAFWGSITPSAATEIHTQLGSGWDHDWNKGDAAGANNTYLDFAAPSGNNTVTIPAATGTIMLSAGGTTNYMTKFTGATTIGDSMITDDGVNGVRFPNDYKLLFSSWPGGGGIYEVYFDSGTGTVHRRHRLDVIDTLINNGSYQEWTVGAAGLNSGDYNVRYRSNVPAPGIPDTGWFMYDAYARDMNGTTRTLVDFFRLSPTFTANTGTGNVANGFKFSNITPGANATHNAINFGTGWDNEIRYETATFTTDIGFNTPTANRTIAVPDVSGTFGVVTSTATRHVYQGSTTGELVDSEIAEAAVPAAASGGDVLSIAPTLNDPGAGNTINLFNFNPDITALSSGKTNYINMNFGDADDSSEVVYGINFHQTSNDIGEIRHIHADAPYGMRLGADVSFNFVIDDDATADEWWFQLFTPAANGSYMGAGNITTIAMAPGDVQKLFNMQVAQGAHTGGEWTWLYLDSFTAPNANADEWGIYFGRYMDAGLAFEGSVGDAWETTVHVVNPTADRTILFPNASGTVVLESGLTANKIPYWDGTKLVDSNIWDWGTDIEYGTTGGGLVHWFYLDSYPTGIFKILEENNQERFRVHATFGAAGTSSNDIVHLGNPAVMDGNDVKNMYSSSITNAAHTGANNWLNAFRVQLSANSANATESLLSMRNTFDHLLEVNTDATSGQGNQFFIDVPSPSGTNTVTFPDATGTVALVSAGSGTTNVIPRFASPNIVDGSMSDNGAGTITRAGTLQFAVNGGNLLLTANGAGDDIVASSDNGYFQFASARRFNISTHQLNAGTLTETPMQSPTGSWRNVACITGPCDLSIAESAGDMPGVWFYVHNQGSVDITVNDIAGQQEVPGSAFTFTPGSTIGFVYQTTPTAQWVMSSYFDPGASSVPLSGSSLTSDAIPKWDGSEMADSQITDDGADITLGASGDIQIPSEVELHFGYDATTDGYIKLRDFGDPNQRLETYTPYLGSIVFAPSTGPIRWARLTTQDPNFEMGSEVAAGNSGYSFLMEQTNETAMDSAGDQREFFKVNFPSAAHTAGNKFGVQWSGISPSSANEVLHVMGTGWDHTFLWGNTTTGTYLDFASPSGVNTVTIPAATGTVALQSGAYLDLEHQSGAIASPGGSDIRLYFSDVSDRGAGGPGNDCALIAELANGTEVVISILRTDSACDAP